MTVTNPGNQTGTVGTPISPPADPGHGFGAGSR